MAALIPKYSPIRLGLIILSATLVVGCSGPRIASKKDPAYEGYKVKRMLVVYSDEEEISKVLRKSFTDKFLTRLTGLLGERGVACEVVRAKKDNVEGQDRVREIASQFRPLQVLHFKLTEINSQGWVWWPSIESLPEFRNDVSVTFSLRLEDPSAKKTFWEGVTTVLAPGDPNPLAEGLVQKLASENLVDQITPGKAD